MALRTLTVPVPMPNINRVEINEVFDRRDAVNDPRFAIELHFVGVGGRDAGTHTIIARDVANSNGVDLKVNPANYGDVITSGGVIQVNGACSALALAWDTAYDATVGTRAAKRRAGNESALTKAQEIGLVAAGLASA